MADNVTLIWQQSPSFVASPATDVAPCDDAPLLAKCDRGRLFVGLLRATARPAAIARFVVAIVVDPVKRMLGRRPPTNISEECLERLLPSVADADAPAAVMDPSAQFRVRATFAHLTPRLVFRRTAHSVSAAQAGNGFTLETAATPMLPISEIAAMRSRDISAIAMAEPNRLSADFLSTLDHREATKPHPGQINQWWHGLSITSSAMTGQGV